MPDRVFRYVNTMLCDDGIEVRIANPALKSGKVESVVLTEAQGLRLLGDMVKALELSSQKRARS